MKKSPIYVGIDVSTTTLDVAIVPDVKHWQVSNDPSGIDMLVKHLVTLRPAGVVMEATGGIEMPVAIALYEADIIAALVNPRQVRDFARSLGILAKTPAQAGIQGGLLTRAWYDHICRHSVPRHGIQ